MKKEELKGRIMLVLLAASWGGTFPAMKIAVLDLDVFFFLLLRFCVALATFIPLLALTRRRMAPDLRGLGLGAVVFLGFLFQVFGLKYTSAINSAFITSLNTPLVPLLGFLIFHRKPGLKAVLGIVIGMLGLMLLTGAYEMKTVSIGDLLTFICAFLWALQILLVDKVAKKVDALELAYSEAISVFALSTIFSLSAGEVWKTPSEDATIAVIYTGAVATAFAFYAQAWAQRRVTPEIAGLLLLLEPVFASVFAFITLGEALNLIETLGAILILLGIVISK
ncbi:DMT family transporter [Candidatus Bathyarchaeota archaeon]|nr:DMT family transporter [Candidatus Bathyarchaeota archaeon]